MKATGLLVGRGKTADFAGTSREFAENDRKKPAGFAGVFLAN